MSAEPKSDLYEEQAARQVSLTIPAEYQADVLAAFKALSDAAEILFAFELPDDIEPAPIFHPDTQKW
jgi:hypothetical protein